MLVCESWSEVGRGREQGQEYEAARRRGMAAAASERSLMQLQAMHPLVGPCSPLTQELKLPVLVLHADKDQAFLPSMFNVGAVLGWQPGWQGLRSGRHGMASMESRCKPLCPTQSSWPCPRRDTSAFARMSRRSAYAIAATGCNKTGRGQGGGGVLPGAGRAALEGPRGMHLTTAELPLSKIILPYPELLLLPNAAALLFLPSCTCQASPRECSPGTVSERLPRRRARAGGLGNRIQAGRAQRRRGRQRLARAATGPQTVPTALQDCPPAILLPCIWA